LTNFFSFFNIPRAGHPRLLLYIFELPKLLLKTNIIACDLTFFAISTLFKVARSMETPSEKEIPRAAPHPEGSGLFEHSAASTADFTPDFQGKNAFTNYSLCQFFIFHIFDAIYVILSG